MRYFDEIAPGRNGGGWVDTFDIRYVDRYSEQLWLTVFGKAEEMTLFNYWNLLDPAPAGDRPWQTQQTSINWDRIQNAATASPSSPASPEMPSTRSSPSSADLASPSASPAIVRRTRSARTSSTIFSAMIGIPIELYPTFPRNADVILLTEGAAFDPNLVSKVKEQLEAGKTVVMTSGLWHALEGHGAEDLAEIRYTDHLVPVSQFIGAFGAGAGKDLGKSAMPITIPHLRFLTNDAWPVVRGLADNNGFPMMLMDQYGKGVLYILTIPENFTDLYLLPADTLNASPQPRDGKFPGAGGSAREGDAVRVRQRHVHCGIVPR